MAEPEHIGFDYYIDEDAVLVLKTQRIRVRDVAILDERNVYSNVSDLVGRTVRNQRHADHKSKTFTQLILDTIQQPVVISSDVFIQRYPLLVFPLVKLRKRLIAMDEKSKSAQRYDPAIIVETGNMRQKNPQTMGEFLKGRRQIFLTMRANNTDTRALDMFMVPFKTELANDETQLDVNQDMEVIYSWRVTDEQPWSLEHFRVLKGDQGLEHTGYIVLPQTHTSRAPTISTQPLSTKDVLARPYIIERLDQLPPAVDVISQLEQFDEPEAMYKRYPFLRYAQEPSMNAKLIRKWDRKKLSPRYKKTTKNKGLKRIRKSIVSQSLFEVARQDVEAFASLITRKSSTLTNKLDLINRKASAPDAKKQVDHTYTSFDDAMQKVTNVNPRATGRIILSDRIVYIKRHATAPVWELITPSNNEIVYTLDADGLRKEWEQVKTWPAKVKTISQALKAKEEEWQNQHTFYNEALTPTGYMGPGVKRQQKGTVIGDFDLAEADALRLRDEGYDRNFAMALNGPANPKALEMLAEGVPEIKIDGLEASYMSALTSIVGKLGVEMTIAQRVYIIENTRPQITHMPKTLRAPQERAQFQLQRRLLYFFIASMWMMQSALPAIILKHKNAPQQLDDQDQIIDFIIKAFNDFRHAGVTDVFESWPKDTASLYERIMVAWSDLSNQAKELFQMAQAGCVRLREVRESVAVKEKIASKYPLWPTFLPHPGKDVKILKSNHASILKLALQTLKRRGTTKSWVFQNVAVNQPSDHVHTIGTAPLTDKAKPHIRMHINRFIEVNALFKADEHLKKLVNNCETRSGWNTFSNALRKAKDVNLIKQLLADKAIDHVTFYMSFIRSDLCQFLSRVANGFVVPDGLPEDSIERKLAGYAVYIGNDENRKAEMRKLAEDAQKGLDHVAFAVYASPLPEFAMLLSHYVFINVFEKAKALMPDEMEAFMDQHFAAKFAREFKNRDEVRSDFEKDRERKKQAKILKMRALDNESRLHLKQLQKRNIIHADDVLKMDLDELLENARAMKVRPKKFRAVDDDGMSDVEAPDRD